MIGSRSLGTTPELVTAHAAAYVMEKLGMEPIALLANSHTALITITLIDGYKYCGLYLSLIHIFLERFRNISGNIC